MFDNITESTNIMTENINVLIVEDEERMRDLLSLYLTPKGYNLYMAENSNQAFEILQKHTINVILLDIMLPGVNGFEICEQIRKDYNTPIIMITARNSNEDVIKGLQLGSDDYITKPFDEHILLARIEAVLRRSEYSNLSDSGNNNDKLNIDKKLEIDESAYQIKYNNIEISLTKTEFELINHFIKHPHRVFKREHLMDKFWDFDSDTEDRTIDSHIRNIRDKFRKAEFPIDEYLKTIWGVGYRWDKEV